MKPEGGLTDSDDMDEKDKDPRELLQELGLLVLEARTPDPSAKGRIEGPHCPLSRRTQYHGCTDDRLECRRVRDLERLLDLLWRNSIPVCMDVLLYPDCDHARQEAQVLELCGATTTAPDNYVLLERWTFKFCQKRHMERDRSRSVGASMLLQAVKSYLHFSQLSSWLLSSGGCLPLTIVYRVYAPGESVGYKFAESPDQHSFPQADVPHFGVKVVVSSLPRQGLVTMQCKMPPVVTEDGRHDGCYKSSETDSDIRERGRSLKRTRQHQSEMMRRRDNRRHQAQQTKPAYCTNHSVIWDTLSSHSAACDNHQDLPTEWHRFHEYRDSCQYSRARKSAGPHHGRLSQEPRSAGDLSYSVESSGILPEKSDFRESYPHKCRLDSPSRHKFKQNLLPLKPDYSNEHCLHVETANALSKCLHSPKVLMTSNTKPNQVFTKKKCLDLSTSSESDDWDDHQLSMAIKDLSHPLSPMDIQSYLASLQTVSCTHADRQSSVSPDRCLTPKCTFYIGNESADNGQPCHEKANKSSVTGVSKCLFSSSLSRPDIDNTKTDTRLKLAKSLQADLDQVTRKLQGLSPFRPSESPPAKKEKKDPQQSRGRPSVEEHVANSKHSNTPPTSPDSPSKKCKRKNTDISNCDRLAKCSNVQEDVKVTANGCSASQKTQNGHTVTSPCVHARSQPSEQSAGSANQSEQSQDADQSEQSLCNNCDKPINERLNVLRSFPTTPTAEDSKSFQRHITKSASMMFSSRTGLPTQSSPAPIKRRSVGRFEYDTSLTCTRAIKNAISCSKLVLGSTTDEPDTHTDSGGRILSTSAPASTNCLLGNFEESVLNGRIEPIGVVDGFTAEIGASGSFCPKHVTLRVTAYFFKLSDDNAPSPYLGHVNLESLGKKGYLIPKKGTVQVTLFNPNKTVVKMFVVMYDLSEMPANCQTFLRQRTVYMPVDPNSEEMSYLRYLIHLRFATSRSGKVHLHTDIRLIFARDKFEFDTKVAQYELRSFNEGPKNPKFSPKR